jgi:hypothetical protein
VDLIDIIPIWVTVISLTLGIVGMTILLRFKVIRSVADPDIVALFQITFTFLILLFLGDLLIEDLLGFLLFVGILLRFRSSGKVGLPFISQNDWVSFCKVFSIVLLVLNVYLVSQKGFLLLAPDVASERVQFYEGWGIFRRFNEVGVGLTAITAAVLWHDERRKQAIAMAIFSAYLALTLGSRGGLLACLLAYGAYLHFAPTRVSSKRLVLVGVGLGLGSLLIFFVMFGTGFLGAFAYRVLSFSDGPVYYFHDHMYRYSDYSPTYPFDDLLTDLRLQKNYENPPSNRPVPLGRFINFHHFGEDTPLFGPNPQIFVESHAAFRWLSIFWYGMVAGLFLLLRKGATPFSFFLGCYIAGPLLIDSQFAGSQLFTVMLLLLLVGAFILARFVLRNARTGDCRTFSKD